VHLQNTKDFEVTEFLKLFRPVSNRNYCISDSLQAHQVAWIVTIRRTVSDNDHDQFNSPRELFSY